MSVLLGSLMVFSTIPIKARCALKTTPPQNKYRCWNLHCTYISKLIKKTTNIFHKF